MTALVVALCLPIATGGCGGDDSSDASADSGTESGIPKTAPQVEIPEGLPPKKLVVKELNKGTGATAKKGDKVSLHYNCIVWENGAGYANSWSYSRIPTFVLGDRRLLRGLNLAVPGMKEGGGREVLIPSTMVYYPDVPHPPLGRLGAVICETYLVKVFDEKPRS
ncbi:MAG TPA: FKBP-type peptidyl-prolyl cis-trans isomerase [Solirubrobacterales bacterium]